MRIKQKSFTPSQLQRNSSDVFNLVQAEGMALIESKSRPNMILMLEAHKEGYDLKVEGFKNTMLKLHAENESLKLKLSNLAG